MSINGGEFVILIVVALVVLGPERLPQYAATLARAVRDAKAFALRTKEQVRSEMGDDFEDVDWQALDPRRYDPRRIVREALLDDDGDVFGVSDTAPNVPPSMRPTAPSPAAPPKATPPKASDAGPGAASAPASRFDLDAT